MNKIIAFIVLSWMAFVVYYAFTDPSEEICTEEMARRCQAQVTCIGRLKDCAEAKTKREMEVFKKWKMR